MNKKTELSLHKHLPLPIQQININHKEEDYTQKLKDLEFSVELYQTKSTTRKNFHRPISKML
ncbi:hypothetical protein EZY14_012880 [Kordia sp. TARA_039_SRF]|nr:hypothetical protein EZY14_012880 [Kordia sp. TARA_039_SRF]